MSYSDPRTENLNGIYRNASDVISETHFKAMSFRNITNFFAILAVIGAVLLLSGIAWVEPVANGMLQAERKAHPLPPEPPPGSMTVEYIPSSADPDRAFLFTTKSDIWLKMFGFFMVSIFITTLVNQVQERYSHERDEALQERFSRNPHDDAALIEIKLAWLKNMANMKSSPLDRKNIQKLGYSPSELLS